MPLPAMAGDAATMLDAPGMSAPPSQGGEGQQQVDPKAQARGAVELTSKVKTFNQEQLEALATQFPSVSKEAQEILKLMSTGMDRLMRKILSTTEMPEPASPRIVR